MTSRASSNSNTTSEPREHFISVDEQELVQRMVDQLGLPKTQRDRFVHVCHLLEAALHADYHWRMKTLKRRYAPFDPDGDGTLAPTSIETFTAASDADRDVCCEAVIDDFVGLLRRANFFSLSPKEIEEATRAASDWGVNLHIDFTVFERLEVWARGDSLSRRQRRRWRNLRRREEIDVATYDRLVVIFRLRPHERLGRDADTRNIHIKLFKNIPKMDLEMLLPGTRFRMSLFDQGSIWLPTISGLGLTAWRILQGALVLVFTGLKGALASLALIAGMLGYGVKSFFGYLNTKNKYQLNLTRSLYYQNLDNNAGVLFRLLDTAEAQDYREMLLAFFFLWKEAGGSGWTTLELDAAAERQLTSLTDSHIDFDVVDALGKLERLGLITHLPDDRWRAVSLNEAQIRLEEILSRGELSKDMEQPFGPPHCATAKWGSFTREWRGENSVTDSP